MIYIYSDNPDFEYDVYGVVKAFYPRQEIKYFSDSDKNQQEAEVAELVLKLKWDMDLLYPVELSLYKEEILVASGKADPQRETSPEALEANSRTETKNILKRMIYRLLSDYTGQTLPWGTLTGIRPTKIPMGKLMEGMSRSDTKAFMRETYLISEDKADLALEIADREREILSPIDYDYGYSLYIGIPFCPTTCLYCSFTSYAISAWRDRVEEYLDCLEREMQYVGPTMAAAGKKLQTVYMGGGTPTTLEADQMGRLLSMIGRYFDLSQVVEFTIEGGRPDSLNEEKLKVMWDTLGDKKLFSPGATHVGRISINPQTMNQKTLDTIGRRHTVEQTIDSFQLARKVGFDNINMDIILGLPGETVEDVSHTLSEIQKLGPDSLTVHSLAIKRAARLNMEQDYYLQFGMENSQKRMELCKQIAQAIGLRPYYLYRQKNMAGNLENIGYAQTGKEGIYNILIMEELHSIIAIGAGGQSKVIRPGRDKERIETVKDVKSYMARIDEMIERKKAVLGDL